MPLILPTPKRKEDLRFIHKCLLDFKQNGDGESLAKGVARMVRIPEFAAELAADRKFRAPERNSEGIALAWRFLYFFLNRRDYVAASFILWGPKTFTPEPHCAQLMWNALFEKMLINVMGCASVGKTFAPSAWMLLDWLLDPEWTRVEVGSSKEKHVKKNLFGDLVRLHQEAALSLPGKVDSESISLDKKRAMGIFVLTIPGGPTAKGTIKGMKIKNRPFHPLFGESSRFRVILDESQEIPANIFDEIPNLLASVDNSVEHIKILCGANAKDEFSRYGQNCKPVGGWEAITDEAEEWEGETGWWVISINAMRTENVMQRKTVFPRLITYEGVQKIIRSQAGGNDQHPICFTFIYGRFPKSGLLGVVVKPEHVRRSERDWIFDQPTISIAGSDPAYTGDNPTIACGRIGRAIGWLDYDGGRHLLDVPAVKIQVDVVAIIGRGDTQDMTSDVLERCRQLNVRPSGFGIDRTGIGQGIHDLIQRQWRSKVGLEGLNGGQTAKIVGIHYSESPSNVKICEEDTETPRETYDRIATELYFAAAKLLEHDCVGFSKGVDAKTYEELCSRRGGMQVGLGRKLTLESKDAFKLRTGGTSPDRADCVTILLHVARMSHAGLIPKAKDTQIEKPERGVPAWAGFNQEFGASSMSGMSGAGEMADLLKD